jgi:hypothetical protein
MRTLIGKNPLTMMTELVEHNLSLWKSVNEQLQKPYTPPVTISEIFPSVQPGAPSDPPASAAPREKPDKERKGRKDKDA